MSRLSLVFKELNTIVYSSMILKKKN